MKEFLIIIIFIFGYWNVVFGQSHHHYPLDVDTAYSSAVVYDYFRQVRDSVVQLVRVELMPGDSCSLMGQNTYDIVVHPSDSNRYGELKIFFKDRLLYSYLTLGTQVSGQGFCYYPFRNSVAIQGNFKNGVLDGNVFVLGSAGEVLEVMDYKSGVYQRQLYHWQISSKQELKRLSRKRSINPLKSDEIIVR